MEITFYWEGNLEGLALLVFFFMLNFLEFLFQNLRFDEYKSPLI